MTENPGVGWREADRALLNDVTELSYPYNRGPLEEFTRRAPDIVRRALDALDAAEAERDYLRGRIDAALAFMAADPAQSVPALERILTAEPPEHKVVGLMHALEMAVANAKADRAAGSVDTPEGR